jgi:hypothetical protein
MPITGDVLYPFKWYYRPETGTQTVPVVQVFEDREQVEFEEISGILQEIDNRHWAVVRQLLIEAKLKAESQLRSDEIISNPQLSAHYQGWVNYADYVLGNFEGLRAGAIGTDQAKPLE